MSAQKKVFQVLLITAVLGQLHLVTSKPAPPSTQADSRKVTPAPITEEELHQIVEELLQEAYGDEYEPPPHNSKSHLSSAIKKKLVKEGEQHKVPENGSDQLGIIEELLKQMLSTGGAKPKSRGVNEDLLEGALVFEQEGQPKVLIVDRRSKKKKIAEDNSNGGKRSTSSQSAVIDELQPIRLSAGEPSATNDFLTNSKNSGSDPVRFQSAKLLSHIVSEGDEPFRTIPVSAGKSFDFDEDDIEDIIESRQLLTNNGNLNIQNRNSVTPPLQTLTGPFRVTPASQENDDIIVSSPRLTSNVGIGLPTILNLEDFGSIQSLENAVSNIPLGDLIQSMIGKNQMAIVPLGGDSTGAAIIANLDGESMGLMKPKAVVNTDVGVPLPALTTEIPTIETTTQSAADIMSESSAILSQLENELTEIGNALAKQTSDVGVPLPSLDTTNDVNINQDDQLFNFDLDNVDDDFGFDSFDDLPDIDENSSESSSDSGNNKLNLEKVFQKKKQFFQSIFGGMFNVGNLIDLL